MDFPRRSARLSHANNHNQQQTSSPAFSQFPQSQTSSTSTSSYPSPNEGIHTAPPTPSRFPARLKIQSSMPQYHHNHLQAPLPSPSASDFEPLFDRPHSQPTSFPTHLQQHNIPQAPSIQPQQPGYSQQPQQSNHHFQQHQYQQYQHYPHQPPHNSFSQQNMGQAGQPGALPQDFLAEAAKRAQMACLMRDLGDVSL